jgi:hypothetical protein
VADVRIRHEQQEGPRVTVVVFEIHDSTPFVRGQIAELILEAAAGVVDGDVPVQLSPSH